VKIILILVVLLGVLIGVIGYKVRGKSIADNQNFMPENAALLIALSEPEPGARVLQLIQEGADVNAKDREGKTALIIAAEKNLPEVVKLLVAAGADINAKDKQKRTALVVAVEAGNVEVVKLLLAAGADFPYEQATDLAKKNGHKDIWKLLIYSDLPPLIEREGVFDTPEEMKAYLAARANETDKLGLTPLLRAINAGDADEVKTLISEGANVNFVNQFQESTLLVAVKKNQIKIIPLLITAGADVNYKDAFGRSILQIAQQKKFTQAADLLKSAGAKE